MRVVRHWRPLAGVFVVVMGLVLVGCTADNGQPPGADASDVDSPASGAAASSAVSSAVECLRDRGWEIVVDSEGFGAPGIPEAQFDAYVADVDECTRLNETIEPLEDIPPERWEKAYADTVESAQCLRDQGYDIPETPSLQAWRDSYFVDDGASQWVPWGFVPVPSMSGSELRALEAICPQVGL